MYYKQIEWLEQLLTDEEIEKLIEEREDARRLILKLKARRNRAAIVFGQCAGRLQNAIDLHRDLDTDLSLIDGRFKIIEPVKPKKRKKKEKIVDLKKLSKEQRQKLIEELKAISSKE